MSSLCKEGPASIAVAYAVLQRRPLLRADQVFRSFFPPEV
jgi:hypothetical protein